MKGLLKRLRGVIKTGLTWAIGWTGLYGVALSGFAVFGGVEGWELFGILGSFFIVSAVGFIAGSSFAAILSIVERRKRLEDLSLWRIAVWGGLGGILLAAVLGVDYMNPVGLFTVLGVGSATGTVALARRGDDTTLLEGDDEPLPALEGE
jgi:hypothetical protein